MFSGFSPRKACDPRSILFSARWAVRLPGKKTVRSEDSLNKLRIKTKSNSPSEMSLTSPPHIFQNGLSHPIEENFQLILTKLVPINPAKF